MAVTLLVKGIIRLGQLHDFSQTVGDFTAYRRERNWAVPEILYGISGPMNTVLMVFRYPDMSTFEAELAAERLDASYAQVASRMPYAEGTIHYDLYQSSEP